MSYIETDPAKMTALDKLIAQGSVWQQDGEYFGLAADGVIVCLGMIEERATVERYLADHPTPETW